MHLFIEVCHRVSSNSASQSSHADLDERSNVLIFNSTLAFNLVESSAVGSVSHGLILEIALSTLITDRAVEGVVGQQEFHDALSCLVNERRICLDHHAGLDRPRARGNRLRGPLDLDQAHAATSSNHQLFVVAVSWDGDTGLFASLDQGGAG